MRLRNKKTGDIAEVLTDSIAVNVLMDQHDITAYYTSLAELNEEWEDYEEPKEYYWVDYDGKVKTFLDLYEWQDKMKEIGNYFETREEAEKAVEKLKAWKTLKDKGFRFTLTPGVGSLDITPGKFQIEINADMPEKWFCCDAVQKDLDLLFGGEE